METRIITDKQLPLLEKMLNSDWDLSHVAACDKQVIYLLTRRKTQERPTKPKRNARS